MNNFVVSALRYRPKSFDDVVGQRSITTTLERAIEKDHLAQALLFTGPRGVGKTTCARILARMINSRGENDKTQDFSFNIFELDAASNNSVDDIRNLTDQVRIPPQVGSYKVYIIDEVHMLSTSAFNAFLKTLEEPPKHCIFILATTEKQKIIPTILSRCQIYDFKRISTTDIMNYLKLIAKDQNINADEDALFIIAKKSDGAMRDALSIFDRMVSYCGVALTKKAVYNNLDIIDFEVYFEFTDQILNNNIPQILIDFNKILLKGFGIQNFINGLASHFRDLYIAKTPEMLYLVESASDTKKLYVEQAKISPENFLKEAINLTNECDLNFRNSKNQRLLAELCLMKLASISLDPEKKKSNLYIIPPSFFQRGKSKSNLSDEEVNVESELKLTNEENLVDTYPAIEESVDIKENLTKSLTFEKGLSSGLSFKSIKTKKEHQLKKMSVVVDKEDLPVTPYSKKSLIKYWNEYVLIMENKGRHNLAAILKLDKPKMLADFKIGLEFPNSTNKLELENEKNDLLLFLKKSLNNHEIDLSITVNEEISSNIAYTPIEKYEKLKEKNPSIERLKRVFNLEI